MYVLFWVFTDVCHYSMQMQSLCSKQARTVNVFTLRLCKVSTGSMQSHEHSMHATY